MTPPFSSFRALSFDVYGTLIDWERGVTTALHPLLTQLPDDHALKPPDPSHPPDPADDSAYLHRVTHAFLEHEVPFLAQRPILLYPDLLSQAYSAFAQALGLPASNEEAQNFGASVGAWPTFPDTIAALDKLRTDYGYKLILLSNVDNASISRSIAEQLSGVEFDAVLTAEDIGSYKPDARNFEALIKKVGELGVERRSLLHVAVGVHSDLEPCAKIGLEGAWIRRRAELDELEGVKAGWVFESMGEFVGAVTGQRDGR